MTTGNTALLGLALPVEGELDGSWGDVVNQSITELVDSAVAGTTTLSIDADVTLTTTVLAANQARQAVLLWTASNGATTRNITAPSHSKQYIVINAGTGSVVLRGTGPTTGVTIAAGEKCLAAWNGTDFVKIATSVAGGVTSVGGTGTVNGLTLTGTVTSSGNLTLGGALANVDLTTQVTGTLPVANGGTGTATLTANNVLLGNGTSALQVVAPGSNGNVLTSNGTTWLSQPATGGSGGSLVKISTTTISTSTAAVTLRVDSSLYKSLLIVANSVMGSTTSAVVTLWMTDTTGAIITATPYQGSSTQAGQSSVVGVIPSTGLGLPLPLSVGSSNSFPINLQLSMVLNTGAGFGGTGAISWFGGSSWTGSAFSGVAGNTTISKVDGVRIAFSSGNITAGTFILYGVLA